ncbi:MAG: hypothetical protein KBA66_25390 [Leptospiraceae bacterium]|nr:hypothetical protein [Leptospiraceae bacterium]
MKPKFDLAPQERLLFVRKLLPIFLEKILGHPEALVTDESRIYDFTENDIDDSIGKGKKAGHYLFKRRWRMCYPDGRKTEFKEEIQEQKAIHQRKWLIRKCKRIFGVDITDCYDKEIPIVLKHIMVNVSREKAIELGLV